MKYLHSILILMVSITIYMLMAYPAYCQQNTEITNGIVTVRAAKGIGFELVSKGQVAVDIRFSSSGLITASKAEVSTDGLTLTFSGLASKRGSGLRLGDSDSITVSLAPNDPYPAVAFDLNIKSFDPEKWQSIAGKQPFHFLAMYMPEAEVWHQHGWLNETPVADPFPLLLDVHVGSPEISAYKYNRNWGYTVPLGGHPTPVIGLWAPKLKHYVGIEFESTRLDDNSERDIATGYCWGDGSAEVRKPNPNQFAALVYPHGGRGFQDLVFPKVGSRINSRGKLLWSLDLPASNDPNRFFYTYVWDRYRNQITDVPSVVDLSWLPGDARLNDFVGPGSGGTLIVSFSGTEAEFSTPGTKLTLGWTAFNESIIEISKNKSDKATLDVAEKQAQLFMGYAKQAVIDGDECMFWEKPLEGRWSDRWGGAPVTTIHNPESFHAGRLFLNLYRFMGKTEYLPVVDKVFNWAKHIAWTRNELADIPSSPSGIGALPCQSFCLDYYMTFKDAPDKTHRDEARKALDMARSFAYRYMSVWLSDSNRMDNLSSAYQWEVTSGRDWTAAACTADMMIDVQAMTAVLTGDPLLMRVVNGSITKFNDLYQETYRDTLTDYKKADFTEAYGLYEGATAGVGRRAPFGGFFQMVMIQPVGNSIARVLAGEKAAMVFNKDGVHTSIKDYRYTPDGNLSFTVKSGRPEFDISVTVPYVDISGKPVDLIRNGDRTTLVPGKDFIRPPQAVWSLMIKKVHDGDQIIIGSPKSSSRVLPSAPPSTNKMLERPGFEFVKLPYDSIPNTDWTKLDSWAAIPYGEMWAYGIPFDMKQSSEKSMLTKQTRFSKPIRGAKSIYLTYSAGDGSAPSIIFEDGSKQSVNTQLEVMAWRAWPPIYTSKLVTAPVDVDGKVIAGVDPGRRSISAMTAVYPKLMDSESLISDIDRAFASGVKAWQDTQTKERMAADLKTAASKVPSGSIAILPPNALGRTYDYLQRAGLLTRSTKLTPEQLVDPDFFTPKRFPVAFYAAEGYYIHTVKTPGDGVDAILRYVKQGGTLILSPPGAAWPFYLASGPGFVRGEPLTDKLGMPLDFAIDESQPENMIIKSVTGQTVLQGIPAEFPWPLGDIRLRIIRGDRVPAGAKYTPIYTVYGESGKSYGDAAGLVELPDGGGRILFVFGLLMADPDTGATIANSIVRYLVDTVEKK
ncbi:MAG: hypothetical protein ACYC0V_14590 [Armatimonadota bacterium]